MLAAPAMAAGPLPTIKNQAPALPAQTRASACPATGTEITGTEREIRTGSIEVYTPVTGVTTAQETYDVFAPFDGRVEEVHVELFNFVTPQTTLGRIVSKEMAALLDSTTEGGRKQTERRWQDVYKYYDIKPEAQGVVTNIYTSQKTPVYKGDRLFTVAKKVILIGKNTAPLYSKLATEMTADIQHYRTAEKFKTRLTNFIRLKDSVYYNRLWLEVLDLRTGIRIGEQFDGSLFVGSKTGTRLVPRKNLLEKNGKKYLLLEVETGLITEEEAEINQTSNHYLEIKDHLKETEDGKK